MQTRKPSDFSPRDAIENAVKTEHPATVAQLAQLVTKEAAYDDLDFVTAVKAMAADGSLVLQQPSYEIESALDYLFTLTLSGWFWSAMGVTLLAVIATTLIPDFFPINIIRWALGSIFVLYLPGYTLMQFLFPKGSEIDSLERFALSVGVSLAVVPLIGLVLNYLPWGIRFEPIIASLSGFTVLFAVAAAARKYYGLGKRGAEIIRLA